MRHPKLLKRIRSTGSLRWILFMTELPRRCFLTTAGIGFPHLGRSVWILFRKSLKLRSGRNKYVGYETDDEPELVETPDGNYYRIELEAEDDREVILKIREDGSLLQ